MEFHKSTMRRCVAAAVALLLTLPVHAQSVDPVPAPASQPRELDQMIYKGVVGNLLDHVPMESRERLDLQRANAIVGNAAAARSVAILLGLTASPLVIVGGLAWGIYAASRIKPASAPQADIAAPTPALDPIAVPHMELAALAFTASD